MHDAKSLIRFPCHCGRRFALTADHANGTVQCPDCGRLNDVPSLSDLDSISSDDGTLLMKEAPPLPPTNRVADVDRAFRPRRVDDHGREIDQRQQLEDLVDVGAPPEDDVIPLRGDDARPSKPKYDPVTGELIRPMQLARTDDMVPVEAIPVAKPVQSLVYATGDAARRIDVRRILVDLCFPTNMVVMLFILVLHLLNQMATFALVGGFFFIAPVAVILSALILAHYGNTIDETGPEEMDELPRPIRGMSFSEDIWRPFVHVAGSLMICYGPAVLVLTRTGLPPRLTAMLAIFFAVAGSLFLPAVLLTSATSGTLFNLRPDRLIGVIRAARGHYLISVFAWLLTIAAYVVATTGSLMMIVRLFAPAGAAAAPATARPLFVYPLLMIAIFCAHFFCWHLGLIYRDRHAEFPWVLQRHVSQRRINEAERAAAIRAQRRKPGYVQQKRG